MQSGIFRLYLPPQGAVWRVLHNETGCKESSGILGHLQGLHRRTCALCKQARPPLRARVQVM